MNTIGDKVVVNLFDGQVKDQPGTIIAKGETSTGETVYNVEMKNKPATGDFHVGKAQVQNGKCWVLSVYAEELKAA